jgi:hypothetical protein
VGRASVPIETDSEPSKYADLVVLRGIALSPAGPISLRVYGSIILSGTAGQNMVERLPWLVLSVLGGRPWRPHVARSLAASEGCHSIAQLIISDLQTSMGDDTSILQMVVCPRVSLSVTARRLPVLSN